jgi:hypothetical protein
VSAVFLKREPNTAWRVTEILGLPDENWSEIEVQFGLDQPATATVTLLITKEQLRQLVDATTGIG